MHHAAGNASDIAIIKPVIRDHAPELLTEYNDRTPLNIAKHNHHPAVAFFVTEVDTAFRNCNYPALIKLCGSTPAWKHEVKLAKDKKDKADRAEADRLEAVFFDWDQNGVRENSASQPPPQPPPKKKKPKKKKKTAAQKAAEVETAQAIEPQAIKAVLATAEPSVPPQDERKPAAKEVAEAPPSQEMQDAIATEFALLGLSTMPPLPPPPTDEELVELIHERLFHSPRNPLIPQALSSLPSNRTWTSPPPHPSPLALPLSSSYSTFR